MTTRVLFLQGAGEGAHAEDEALAASLRAAGLDVTYPALPNEEEPDPAEWVAAITAELTEPTVLVGHSIGGSIAPLAVNENVVGLFLIAAPFWGGDGWTYDGWEDLALPEGLTVDVPVFLYQSRDDEVVPFAHLALWAAAFPSSTVRELDAGGHQMGEDLSVVAADIWVL